MQDEGLIACPPQFHDIAFVDADELLCVGDPATLYLDVKGELRRGDTGAPGGDQQQCQRPSWRNETQRGASLDLYRPEFD
jgi:hypothetical protein